MRSKASIRIIQVGLLFGVVLAPLQGASARPGLVKVRATLLQATKLLDQKRYAEASASINRSPDIAAVPEAQCMLVLSYLGERRYQDALDSWERCDKDARGLDADQLRELALARDRSRAGLLTEQGLRARGAQRCEDAEDAFKKAYLLSEHPRLLCEQADAVSCRGQLDDALALYERCLSDLTRRAEEAPSAEELEALRARRQQVLGDLERSRSVASRAPTVEPTPPSQPSARLALVAVPAPLHKDTPAQAKKPFYRRPLFYVGASIGLAAAATAASIPAMLPGEAPPPPPDFCMMYPERCPIVRAAIRISSLVTF